MKVLSPEHPVEDIVVIESAFNLGRSWTHYERFSESWRVVIGGRELTRHEFPSHI